MPNESSDQLDPSQLLRVLTALKKGDFTARMPVDKTGVAGKIADTLNEIIELNELRRAQETERLFTREALQRDFVASVSHELRTPIAAIKGSAETLRLGGLLDERNRMRFIRIIEKHADKLGWIVEDILTLNAMESGKVKPRPEPLALRPLVERIAARLAPIASRRAVRVSVAIEDSARAVADPYHAAHVVRDLLLNAIESSVRDGCVAVEAREEGPLIHLSVADTGAGIAAHHLPLIFQAFHRMESAGPRRRRDSGLGLYLIKAIVESNGGQIWAHSEPGKGSEFHLTLPSAAHAAAAPARGQLAERRQ